MQSQQLNLTQFASPLQVVKGQQAPIQARKGNSKSVFKQKQRDGASAVASRASQQLYASSDDLKHLGVINMGQKNNNDIMAYIEVNP